MAKNNITDYVLWALIALAITAIALYYFGSDSIKQKLFGVSATATVDTKSAAAAEIVKTPPAQTQTPPAPNTAAPGEVQLPCSTANYQKIVYKGINPKSCENKVVQAMLNKKGFSDANGKPLVVDGDWGEKTEAAFKKAFTNSVLVAPDSATQKLTLQYIATALS